jgi:hypothetical protein
MDWKMLGIGVLTGLAVGTLSEVANYISSSKKNKAYLDLVAKEAVREKEARMNG